MNNTETEKPVVTWTQFRGEWMIRSNVKLGAANTIDGKIDQFGISCPGSVEVTAKSGATKIVRVGEYEKAFSDGHIYSVI